MKKVFKVNLGVVMAVCAAFSLMSFKMNESARQSEWYDVNGTTVETTPTGAPDEEFCSTEEPPADLCAVKYTILTTEPFSRPTNVTALYQAQTDGDISIDEEAYTVEPD